MNFASHIVPVDFWEDFPDEGNNVAVFTPYGHFLFIGFLATAVIFYLAMTDFASKELPRDAWPTFIGLSALVSIGLDLIVMLLASVIYAVTNVKLELPLITVVLAAVLVALMFIANRRDIG